MSFELFFIEKGKKYKITHFKWGKGIWSNIKSREFHIVEEAIKVLGEENSAGQGLMAETLSQHHAAVQSHFWSFIAAIIKEYMATTEEQLICPVK